MADETDEYGKRKLPEKLHTFDDAAVAARALGDFFGDGERTTDDYHLAQMANALAAVCEARASKPWEDDRSRYGARVTFVDGEGEAHTAIVLEPEVAAMEADEAWDPHRGEEVDPREAYPLGTVQLVYPEEGQFTGDYFFDRVSGLEDATSVTPAAGPDDTYCYYPGWDYALDAD